MKNKLFSKKSLLLILVVLLLLILSFNFFKGAEQNISSFDPEDEFYQDQTKENNKEIEINNSDLTLKENINKKETINKRKIMGKNNFNEKTKNDQFQNDQFIKEEENFRANNTAVEVLKDPFRKEETADSSKEGLSLNKTLFLEKELNSENNLTKEAEEGIIIEKEKDLKANKKSENNNQNTAENSDQTKDTNKKTGLNTETKTDNSLKNLKLPFKLLGIIKNKNNSSAILLYQGKKIIKKEKEMVNLFLIDKILNKALIISYKDQQKRIQLWGAQNEN